MAYCEKHNFNEYGFDCPGCLRDEHAALLAWAREAYRALRMMRTSHEYSEVFVSNAVSSAPDAVKVTP